MLSCPPHGNRVTSRGTVGQGAAGRQVGRESASLYLVLQCIQRPGRYCSTRQGAQLGMDKYFSLHPAEKTRELIGSFPSALLTVSSFISSLDLSPSFAPCFFSFFFLLLSFFFSPFFLFNLLWSGLLLSNSSCFYLKQILPELVWSGVVCYFQTAPVFISNKSCLSWSDLVWSVTFKQLLFLSQTNLA